jgi:hypothetical protein
MRGVQLEIASVIPFSTIKLNGSRVAWMGVRDNQNHVDLLLVQNLNGSTLSNNFTAKHL